MARKCTKIRKLSSTSFEFHKYASLLTPKLYQLYQLTFEGVASASDQQDTAGGEWSGAAFFHGTGHCGCLVAHLNSKVDKEVDITVEQWCSSSSLATACATKGILSFGHLDTCLVSAGGNPLSLSLFLTGVCPWFCVYFASVLIRSVELISPMELIVQ